MAKGKSSSANMKKKYSLHHAKAVTNKKRNVESELKRVEKNSTKQYKVPRGTARKLRRKGLTHSE